jgi:hypothetical protein
MKVKGYFMTSDVFLTFLFLEDFNFLWIFVIILISIIGMKIYIIGIKSEMDSIKKMNKGYGIFLFAIAISRIFHIIANFYYEQDPVAPGIEFELAKRISYSVAFISLALMTYSFEQKFKKTKGIIALIPLILAILTLLPIIPYEALRIINYVSTPISLILIITVYIYLARITVGDIRRRALISGFGLVLAFGSIGLDGRASKDLFTELGLRWIPYIVSPIMITLGTLLFYSAISKAKRE